MTLPLPVEEAVDAGLSGNKVFQAGGGIEKGEEIDCQQRRIGQRRVEQERRQRMDVGADDAGLAKQGDGGEKIDEVIGILSKILDK